MREHQIEPEPKPTPINTDDCEREDRLEWENTECRECGCTLDCCNCDGQWDD